MTQEQLSLWDFDGQTYDRERDGERLGKQMTNVLVAARMHWHTLGELADLTGYPEASISARLRDLRKPKFGGWNVERRYIENGLWEYRVTTP